MDLRGPLFIAAAVGIAVGAFAPRALGPQDHAAPEPFAYAPPDGYVASDDAKKVLDANVPGGTRIWVRPVAGPTTQLTPNVSVVTTPKQAPSDEPALASLAAGMPAIFSAQGTTWRELRHGMHARPDGARVAFLEGTASHAGLAPYRVLQIVFPTNDGSAIVTASFTEDGAAESERQFDATIDAAHGVAYRAPPPPMWKYGAWGVGAGLFAFVAAIAAKRAGKG